MELFFIAQDETPLGTLPCDEEALAFLLRITVSRWRDLVNREASPLHGRHPVLCDNGQTRLAHPVVTEVALEALNGRRRNNAKNADDRMRKRLGTIARHLCESIPGGNRLAESEERLNALSDWIEAAYTPKPAGHAGRKAIQHADAFDVMAAKAARHGKPSPLTPTQIAMGRYYRDLVERYEAAGTRSSSIESLARSSGGNGGEFIDAVLRDRERIAILRRRIGEGSALVVRRIRPSKRGTRTGITDRRLVDMVCIEERAMSEVLKAHGWAVFGESVRPLTRALSLALERMVSNH